MSAAGGGAGQLQALARDLRAAGSPRGLRLKLRRNITSSVAPMKAEAKAQAKAIPVKGTAGSTGLREAISKAIVTRTRITPTTVYVRLIADPKKMPAGQGTLPSHMEFGRWGHPVFGNRDVWVTQQAHAYFMPAIARHLPEVRAGVLAAAEETAAELSRGGL